MDRLTRLATLLVIINGPFAMPGAVHAEGRALHVGPGQRFAEVHQTPKLQKGDRLFIHWRSQPYPAKIAVNVSDVRIVGVSGPNGQLPTLDGVNAIEVPWASYWSNQIARQGIITVTPPANGPKVRNVVIEGLRLTRARADSPLKQANGKASHWNVAAAGVALYKCEDVTITACTIGDNDNGVFGKSYGNAAGDLRNITIQWCQLNGNGVSGVDRFHNSYIEGIRTLYQFNHYNPPAAGSAGCNLKDRGAGTVIRYCRIEGGARTVDLVDPEDGAPTFTADPAWGRTFVYGNVLVNPLAGGSASMIHFGFDGLAKNAQKRLYYFHNTLVSCWPKEGATWYVYPFKTNGAQELYLANNIFHGFGDSGREPSEFRFVYDDGAKQTKVFLKANWLPSHAQKADVQPEGWEDQATGGDPHFLNQATFDIRLKPDSPCRDRAVRLNSLGWPLDGHTPEHSYDPADLTWRPRSGLGNLGASEHVRQQKADPAPAPAPPPMPDQAPAEPERPSSPVPPSGGIGPVKFIEKDTGIPAGSAWPWGLVAFDYDGDGRPDLLVQQHNGGSLLFRNLDGKAFAHVDVGSTLGGTFRPSVWDFDGDGRLDLAYRDSKAKTFFRNTGDGYAPLNFKYELGNSFITQIADFDGDGYLDFGYDYGRWLYQPRGKTYKRIPHTNPVVAKLPTAVAKFVNGQLADNPQGFMKVQYIQTDLNRDGTADVVVSGFKSYGGLSFGRYLITQPDGVLADASTDLGLPLDGAPISFRDYDADGSMGACIVGAGYYRHVQGKYLLQAGPLTDFLKVSGVYSHEAFPVDLDNDRDLDLVVMNPRGRDTRVFRNDGDGKWILVHRAETWDGQPVAVSDINGDGLLDICLGAGDTVKILVNQTQDAGGFCNVHPHMPAPNPFAAGALVEAFPPGTLGESAATPFLAESAHPDGSPVHMGLGDWKAVDLRVTFPNGAVREMKQVRRTRLEVSPSP
jgi:hypothetical protein